MRTRESSHGYNKETRERRVEERDTKMEGLVRNAELVSDTMLDLYEIPVETEREEVLKILDSKREHALAGLSDEGQNKYQELSALSQRRESEVDSFEKFLLFTQIWNLMQYSEVQLMNGLDSVLDSLDKKNEMVQAFKKDSGALDALLRENLVDEDVENGIKDVILGLFDVTVIMKPEAKVFQVEDGEAMHLGLHYRNTPLSVIRDGEPSAMERSDRHEKVHNIADGYSAIKDKQGRLAFEIVLKGTIEAPEEGEGYFTDKADKEEYFGDVLRSQFTSASLVDSLHEELLAELSNAENRRFRGKGALITFLDGLSKAKGRGTQWGFSDLATAGSDAKKIMSLIDEYQGKLPDKQSNEHLGKIKISIEKLARRVVWNADSATHVASLMSEEAHRFVHGAMVILRPTQYHHLMPMLKEKFPEADVQNAVEISAVMRNFSGSMEHVKALYEYFSKDGRQLSVRDHGAVREFMRNILTAGDDMDERIVMSAELVEEYAGYVEWLQKMIVSTTEDLETSLRGRLWYHVYFNALKNSVEGKDFGDNLISEIDPVKEEALDDAVSLYVSDFLTEDYWNSHDGIITQEAALRLSALPLIKKAGYSKLLDSVVLNEARWQEH